MEEDLTIHTQIKRALRWASWVGEVLCYFHDQQSEKEMKQVYKIMDAATDQIQSLINADENPLSRAYHEIIGNLKHLDATGCEEDEKSAILEKVEELSQIINAATNKEIKDG